MKTLLILSLLVITACSSTAKKSQSIRDVKQERFNARRAN